MTREIFLLIKSALTGEKYALPEGFSLEQAIGLIKKHQIQNLIYYGAVNCGIDPKCPVMRELFSATCRHMYIDERQRWELEKLYAAFQKNGIAYMPLKGILMKPLYPRPDMRIMGDADILIRLEQYPAIKPLMQALGFTEKLESDHELVWTKPSLFLELHKRVIPSYNKDYAAYFGNGWSLAQPWEGVPGCYKMTDEDQLIYLFTHFAKHYRDGGIGIRHFTDLYVYLKAKPDLDESYIHSSLKILQLDAFYENIRCALSAVFEDGQTSAVTDLIIDVILGSGLYGTENGHILASAVRDKASCGTAKQARRKQMLHLCFPPRLVLQKKYPVLEKAPILLPVMWVVRAVSVLLRKPWELRHHQKRIKLMTNDRIDSYDQSLQAVGLAFNFKE